jgi:hypothetical protein
MVGACNYALLAVKPEILIDDDSILLTTYKWLSLGAKQEHQFAIQNLSKVKKVLTESQIIRAQKLIEGWKVKSWQDLKYQAKELGLTWRPSF